MRYKIVLIVAGLALATSLGFSVYFYSAMVIGQATISDMQGIIIVTWAKQMSIAAYYLEDVTTNTDAHGARSLLQTASDIASSAESSDGTFLWQISYTSIYVSDELGPYGEGYPLLVKLINSTAVEMIKNLAQKIRDTAELILNESITGRDGASFIQRLREKGISDEIITHCVEIQNLAHQIHEFNPKFQ